MTNDIEHIDTYYDTIDNISISSLENASNSLIAYIKREVYKDVRFDYLNNWDKVIIFMLFLGLLLSYLLDRFYKNNPKHENMQKIYWACLSFKKCQNNQKSFCVNTDYILVCVPIGLYNQYHADTTIQNKCSTVTNFSGYLVLKQSITFIKDLLSIGTNTSSTIKDIAAIIYTSSYRSILFLAVALLVSTVFGITKGMIDGYRTRNNNLSSMDTLVAYSIPDVLIVLLMLLLYVYISINFPGVKEALPLKEIILPLISLSIIPSIYITRITFVTVQDELKKEYVKNAKHMPVTCQNICIRNTSACNI